MYTGLFVDPKCFIFLNPVLTLNLKKEPKPDNIRMRNVEMSVTRFYFNRPHEFSIEGHWIGEIFV